MSNQQRGLWWRYRMNLDEYNRLCMEQNYKCKICLKKKALKVDHDHNNPKGVVRGLLCGKCNRGLGLFKDNPDNLVGAIGYLECY